MSSWFTCFGPFTRTCPLPIILGRYWYPENRPSARDGRVTMSSQSTVLLFLFRLSMAKKLLTFLL
jgi:hypothetical protein